MLNKKEKSILKIILDLSSGKNVCLVSPTEVLKRIPYSLSVSKRDFEDILKTLEYDGYIELTESDKKGERIFCITITLKGQGFNRELIHYKRMIYFKLTLTLATALLGFIITRLLMIL
jgi:DNA-binding MarR family transcriptional regulator